MKNLLVIQTDCVLNQHQTFDPSSNIWSFFIEYVGIMKNQALKHHLGYPVSTKFVEKVVLPFVMTHTQDDNGKTWSSIVIPHLHPGVDKYGNRNSGRFMELVWQVSLCIASIALNSTKLSISQQSWKNYWKRYTKVQYQSWTTILAF
jgi:hypothetical protein